LLDPLNIAFSGYAKKQKPAIHVCRAGFVRKKGLEPPRLAAPDPKSGAATNYATSALGCFPLFGTAKVALCVISANFMLTFLNKNLLSFVMV
jgi:hypothetical protein